MNLAVVSLTFGCGLLALAAAACGKSDQRDPTKCGTAQDPMTAEITDVSPAEDASVVNAQIVQSFTIVGRHLSFEPTFFFSAAHQAGKSVPSPQHWTLALNGDDSVYTSEPFSWTNAPAHVELETKPLLTSEGCILELPTTLFKYDVTAP